MRSAAALAWSLACVWLALELCLWVDPAGDGRLGRHGPAARDDRAEIHAAIEATARIGAPPPAALTAAEADHIRDVHGLVVVARWIGLLAAAAVAVTWPWAGRRGLRDGALALVGAGLGLGVVALDWPVFFRCAHPLLFGDGKWDFDPSRHLLAALYTPGYFALRALPAALPPLLLGAAAVVVGRGGSAETERRAWRRRDLWWLVAAAPLVGVAISGGLRLDVPWSFGHLLWSAALAAAMIGGAWVAVGRGHWGGILTLALAAAAVLGIAIGLRAADHNARAVTGAAERAIWLLEQELADGHRYRSIDELPTNVRAQLAPPPGGFGPWYFVPIRGGYLLGFRGPLAWHYEYNSRRGSWNLPRYNP